MYFGKGGACPSIASLWHAYYLAVQRQGAAVVRVRYHLSPNIPLTKSLLKSPGSELPTRSTMGNLDVKKTGTEQVAGHACEVFEGRIIIPTQTPVQLGGSTRQPEIPEITVRIWVEPMTQLVLRYDLVTRTPQSQMPPHRQTLEVKKLRLLKSIPPERFQLPPGTIVTVMDIFKDAPLPKGVRGVPDVQSSKSVIAK